MLDTVVFEHTGPMVSSIGGLHAQTESILVELVNECSLDDLWLLGSSGGSDCRVDQGRVAVAIDSTPIVMRARRRGDIHS